MCHANIQGDGILGRGTKSASSGHSEESVRVRQREVESRRQCHGSTELGFGLFRSTSKQMLR